MWKERNQRGFEGIEWEITKIMDRWLHYMGSLYLGHDINRMEDFKEFINILI